MPTPVGANFLARGTIGLRQCPITAAQTFKSGDFLLAASGAASILVASGNNVGDILTWIGRATSPAVIPDGGTTLSPFVEFIVADDSTEFGVAIYSGTPASSVATPATHWGKSYGLRNDATYGWCVNVDDDTNDFVRVVDFFREDLSTWPNATTAGTTQYARVYVRPLLARCFLSGGRAAT